jgi:hypothetical protein
MKARVLGIKTLGSVVAATLVATIPLMAQATDAEQAEIANLKRQIYDCHHHKRHHRAACTIQPTTRVIEKTIEKPVVIEKIIEKPVIVEKQVMVEKQTESQAVVEQPMEVMQQRVVVEHSKHRTHLLHFGIPFIGLNLF